MQSSIRSLNEVQTQLFTRGNPFDCDGADVIICVTGNPGVPQFYIEFASQLHISTGLPVCVIGQAGHVEIPGTEFIALEKNAHLFNLQGQLEHKLDLIINHIDKRSKIHLVGHSIGAWLILELLNQHNNVLERVSSVNLLFPALQRMAVSPNGKFLNGVLRRINSLIILLFTLVSLLPVWLQCFMIQLYLKVNSLPMHYTDRIRKYIHPKVGQNVLFLAYDEMDTVIKLNSDALNKVKNVTNVIYSSRDGWAPLHYMDDLKIFQPALQLKEVDIDHAFVLRSSERVAEMVSEFIKSKC